jgi:hypothetical protein
LSCTRSPFRNHTIAAVAASIAALEGHQGAALGIGEF